MNEPFTSRLKTICENVLTLEVNTIVSDAITAEKMPPPEHAVIEVATAYRDWLCDRHARKEMWGDGEHPAASAAIFHRVREAAKNLLDEHVSSYTKLLRRVQSISD